MSTKIVIDGDLLAECSRVGKIRFGMLRVAEEITKRLISTDDLDIYLANTKQSSYDDFFLRNFLAEQKTKKKCKILSYPFAGSKIPKIQGISSKVFKYLYPDRITGLKNYDVFHSFYYGFPKGVEKARIPKSITLLDIIPLRLNGYNELIRDVKSIVESIVPNFAIAISEFSKDDVCDYDRRIDPERVFVVPLAANKESFYVNLNREEWQRVKVKYNLPDNYFLSVSSIDKRKNLQHLIYAFNKFILQEKISDLHLVMTGNTSFKDTIFQQLDIDKKTKQKIVFSRPIEENDLSIVYSNAVSFFFMSTYEGFGLPALEAMQCGTPVISSNATSIPEVVGNAGIMLPPNDEDLLCSAMSEVYNNKQLRDDLSIRGLKRANQFSWQRCAEEYCSIFKKIGN